MSASEKAEVLTKVASSPLPKRKVLGELGIPKSTYYRCRARELQGKQDSSTASAWIPWNTISPPEEATALAAAGESPERSS